MIEETLQERQENEMEALKAIFTEDLVDNREATAWKVWRPTDVKLTLYPLHNSTVPENHCSVTLHIKCCPNYPDKPPMIIIEKLHGISIENGTHLLAELDALAIRLCGEVMIFELAQHVQNFLHIHNKPTLSFYDEMLERHNEIERLKMHDLQLKESKENQKIKDEIQKRQEILKSEGRQRARHPSCENDQSDNDDGNDAPELICYSDNKVSSGKKKAKEKSIEPQCTCHSKGVQILRISQKNNRKIHIGKCLGHSLNGSTTYIAIDADNGDVLISKKWCLHLATDFKLRNRQLQSIEHDLKVMSRIRHPSLIAYNAMELQQEMTPKRKTVHCVYIFRDFVLGTSLKYLKTKLHGLGDSLEGLRFVRHIGNGIFNALLELHRCGLIHRDVRMENVFLDNIGLVKLIGVSLDVRLQEIIENGKYCERQTKAQDIFTAAQLMFSLISDNKTGLEIPSQLPSSAKDFFSRCLTEDEHFQWSAEQLLNHGFLKDAPVPFPGQREEDDGYSGSEDDERALAQSFIRSSLPAGGHSRLGVEFEILKWLGKGAFGDVLKVKNKLDGGFYAIKRIKLNPENVQLNKKITREVKLLSRLNHENVVRYYNAWIETIQASGRVDSREESEDVSSPQKSPEKKINKLSSMENAVAKLVPGVKLEWSISDAPIQKQDDSDSDSSESDYDDDEDDGWLRRLPKTTDLDDSSSSIEFEVDTDNQSETLPSEQTVDISRPPTELIHQVLYIQMEFCEKNTLRHAIDNGLYLEHFRAWRLFREIVEGLAHVHQRGMIHRDLKPVNIFLDSNDHVKIGDFGLATKAFTGLLGPTEDKNKTQDELGGSLTGQVGTALYVAPELLQATNKVIYNQKVDIYSLGIILFEMFHAPLDTGMERIKVLTELRNKEIRLPPAFVNDENNKQIHVIRWLLNHDPSLRPTCAELLSSEHVPRAVPEGALAGLVAHALAEKGGRGHRRLVAACLESRATPAEDYTYHSGLRSKPDPVLLAVKDSVIEVFKRHAATEFAPPLMLPRTRVWDDYPNAVKLMTAFGSVVHLPHDLRLPFARYTAYAEVKCMRRYVVDRVFREKHVPGFHPRELLECAFDIVTPKTSSLWPDAELLVVVCAAAARVGLKITAQLNHTTILRGVLVACGVPMDKHADLYPVLVDLRTGRITNLQLQTHLTSLCLNTRDTANLLRLMESDVPISDIRELLAPMMRRSEWSKSMKQAIAELEVFARNAKALGAECSLTVAPCLAYNASQHGGVFWQALCARKLDQSKSGQNKHRSGDLIAVGGRYNTLVEEFWKVARSEKDDESELRSCSVGFSMSLERIAAIVKKRDIDLPEDIKTNIEAPQSDKVCVCIWGAAGSGRDCAAASRRACLARELWAAGCTVCVAECRTTGEAHELTGANLVALLTDDSANSVRLAQWDKTRIQEKNLPLSAVVDYIRQRVQIDTHRSSESLNCGRTGSWCETERPTISVTIITDEKLSNNMRRRYETQTIGAASACLSTLGVTRRVCVLALDCEAACVRHLAAGLDAPLVAHDLHKAFRAVHDNFPRKRKILSEALEVLTSLVTAKSSAEEPTLFALYSIPEAVCRLIT